MDFQTSTLLRFDSWSRPGLKETDILRTTSLETQEDSHTSSLDNTPDEALVEARATLSAVQKRQAASAKPHKTVVQIDVHCTPGSGFEDIVKQLENPCLPTFKLSDLPFSAKEDLYRIASPNEFGEGFEKEEASSLEEELARFPAVQAARDSSRTDTDHRIGCCFYPNFPPNAPLMLLPHTAAPSSPREALPIPSNSSMSTRNEASDCSEDRYRKRARITSRNERLGPESSGDTGGSAGTAGRGKRLACLKCGTHQTPQWRMGPEGPRTMCNACGVKYKKELREREKKEKERRYRPY